MSFVRHPQACELDIAARAGEVEEAEVQDDADELGKIERREIHPRIRPGVGVLLAPGGNRASMGVQEVAAARAVDTQAGGAGVMQIADVATATCTFKAPLHPTGSWVGTAFGHHSRSVRSELAG